MKEVSAPGAPAAPGDIPLSVPEIRGNEWKYIKECLDTNWVSSAGPFVDRFEDMMTEYTGQKYAVAIINGTAALHIALMVAGVKPDDEVLVSALTFIAPVNAIRYIGAWPVFIDADPDYWQMNPRKVADFLEKDCQWQRGALYNKTTSRRVRAILPVHILGHPVNMIPILELARKYQLLVIEDAAESLGAGYRVAAKAKPTVIGSMGDIACFSFNGNKLITTGGGGMLVTDNEAWARRAKYLTTQAKDDPTEYVHKEIGYNYRLTNIQAAMGVAQLEQLDEYVATRRRIADTYAKTLANLPSISPMPEAPWAFSTFWLYTVLIDAKKYGMDSRALLRRLGEAQIQSRPLWQPINLSPAYRDCQSFPCPVAAQLHRDALSLPSSVGLKAQEQQKVIETIVNLARRSR